MEECSGAGLTPAVTAINKVPGQVDRLWILDMEAHRLSSTRLICQGHRAGPRGAGQGREFDRISNLDDTVTDFLEIGTAIAPHLVRRIPDSGRPGWCSTTMVLAQGVEP